MEFSELSQRIIETIAYCDQFGYPLTQGEIARRLIWSNGSVLKKQPFNHSIIEPLIENTLQQLVNNGVIKESDGFYFLLGSEANVTVRRQRAIYSSLKWTEAKAVAATLSGIPWIKGVAITGSLAMSNVSQDDDIDFMIITQDNRLWLTRPLVIFYAWFKGKRRSWQKEEKNSWCFNLWLEESELHSPGLNQSLYVAYEVCQAQFILNRNKVEQRFRTINRWTEKYVPYYKGAAAQRLKGSEGKNNRFDLLFSPMLDGLNWLAFALQLLYMAPHRTREKVAQSLAFFHPRDTNKLVDEQFREILESIKVK